MMKIILSGTNLIIYSKYGCYNVYIYSLKLVKILGFIYKRTVKYKKKKRDGFSVWLLSFESIN